MSDLAPPSAPPRRQGRLPIVTFSDSCDYDGMWSLLSDKCVDITLASGFTIAGVVVQYLPPGSWLRLLNVETEEVERDYATPEALDDFSDMIERIEYL